jgi:hypothetical protein
MEQDKLSKKYFEQALKGEKINITDLYEFSKIKLKRKRQRKKFEKYYHRYVPKDICLAYWGICLAFSMVNSFKRYSDIDKSMLKIEPINGTPKIELCYLDYQYNKDGEYNRR